MHSIELVTPDNALIFRTIRLRALRETPSAFGSTYAREAQYGDDHWIERAAQRNAGGQSATYMALDGTGPCGMAGGLLDGDDPARAHLLSMWVAGSHRRRGIGGDLVATIVAWAAARRVRALFLQVTSDNAAATAFYRDLGFAMTGRTEPHPHYPELDLCEMSQPLPPAATA